MDHEHIFWPLGRPAPAASGLAVTQAQQELDDLLGFLRYGDFGSVLKSPFVDRLLGEGRVPQETSGGNDGLLSDFNGTISHRLDELLPRSAISDEAELPPLRYCLAAQACLVGYAALHAFLQANVTGPPLEYSPEKLLFRASHFSSPSAVREQRAKLVRSLVVDGVGPHPRIPVVELFCLARTIFNHPGLDVVGRARMRLRTNFLHQRLLSEHAPSLQSVIYDDLRHLELEVASSTGETAQQGKVPILLEHALVQMYYGSDSQARNDLMRAAKEARFEFVLTGKLGKRTKFQDKDISQLVVLARSSMADGRGSPNKVDDASTPSDLPLNAAIETLSSRMNPANLDLDDDTLLESINFSNDSQERSNSIPADDDIPESLRNLDPSDQPILHPLDSCILLAFASSITNTSPADGLTREETLPYATRVLDGGSSNWQVYTQALLVRSRIEGYRSRTQERGLFQLQALVDQIIIETDSENAWDGSRLERKSNPTFLPRPQPSEAAPASDRLRFIHQLCPPTRWDLEAELAARWVSIGGLRTALEIYQRLHMWAEIALCHAGLDREDLACRVIRKQLFQPTSVEEDHAIEEDSETWRGAERDPLPPDAPRLLCILGDLEHDPIFYQRAWQVSGERYARAQRFLGKYYFSKRAYADAADAYKKSLSVSRLYHASWFALGSAQLQLERWDDAVETFTRAVQLDEQDAQSWSNLAVALLERRAAPERDGTLMPAETLHVDEEEQSLPVSPAPDPFRNRRDALKALRRAAKLKHDDWRIWENVLIVAGSVQPPECPDMVIALQHIIQLRGRSVGEKCVDEESLARLVGYITSTDEEGGQARFDPSGRGLPRMVADLLTHDVLPLITTSTQLWHLVAQIFLWQGRQEAALDASEKAWRTSTTSSRWETGTEHEWDAVVRATLRLVDTYEGLGILKPLDGAGRPDATAPKSWKLKAKNAIRSIMRRGTETWNGTAGWDRLRERLQTLTESV
ncbi:MAG: hypothetical protein M1826_004635 [Phylliscum demangeonii]|nr:MAG: hypothetical protein M1826_004635 [Phylliscum demangeonii]